MTDKETGADTARECDDPYRSASCVLVFCEARGAGASAHLLLRSRLFTPASWAAWCDDGAADTAAATAAAPTPEAVDAGRPRVLPQWAATAGEEGGRSGRGGSERGAAAVAGAADVLAALGEEGGPSETLVEVFERLLDVEEDEDEDEMLAAARGGAGDATRRVFESLAWVYEHVSHFCRLFVSVRFVHETAHIFSVALVVLTERVWLISHGVSNQSSQHTQKSYKRISFRRDMHL